MVDTGTTMGTGITVMDDGSLYRLLAWLSPSYPVGAFAYSHGIEWVVEDGRVCDEETLGGWIADLIAFGGGWSDAVLFAKAYSASGDAFRLRELNDYALALSPSEERHLETSAQGTAFLKTTMEAWPWPGADALDRSLTACVAYPIAVAVAAAGHGIARPEALRAYIHAVAANLVSAGVRLIPLGQTAGQRILARLEEAAAETAIKAEAAPIEAVGGIAVLSDIAAMRHETQYTRLFRS